MPSHAVDRWNTFRAGELDGLETAHAGLSGAGSVEARQQLSRSFAVILAAQFQGFCRDLHTEAISYLVAGINPPALRTVVRAECLRDRSLDRGNANQATIAGDFNRLGLDGLWSRVDAEQSNNQSRREELDKLNAWRNAIAHHNFDPARLGGTIRLRFGRVRAWRSQFQILPGSLDRVVGRHIRTLTGIDPW